jgi:hypothetical protein
MAQANKSFRLELTKEQQALVLQNTGIEAKEPQLTDSALRTQKEPEEPQSHKVQAVQHSQR